MLNDLIATNLFALMLIFSRIGTALAVIPGFNAPFVNVQARLLLALAMSFAITPLLVGVLPRMPGQPAALLLLIVGEMTIGALIGTVVRIIMGALQTAGTLTSYFASMANAFVHDPISEQQSATLSGFLGTMGLTLVFVTNLHHMLLEGLVDSYGVFAPGAPLLTGDIADYLSRQVGASFALGTKISAPFLLVGVAYYLGLGLLSRLMPQLQVFFIGLPVQIMMQLGVLAIVMAAMMAVFLEFFRDTYSRFLLG